MTPRNLLFLALILGSLLSAPGAFAVAEEWEIQTPDPDVETGLHGNSIVLDSEGRPRISYDFTRRAFEVDLRTAVWDGAGWRIGTVHYGAIGGPVGFRSSYALDVRGEHHITFHAEEPSGTPAYLKHAHVLGTDTLDTFDFGEYTDSSVARGFTLQANVLYTNRTQGGLRFTVTGGITSLIDPGRVHITHNSLAINLIAGGVHVCYHVFTASDDALKYARPASSGTWSTTVVDQDLGPFGECAIAVDAQGRPRIAYADPRGHRVKYAAWNGTAWEIEVVGTDDTLNDSTYRSDISLVLGPGGVPHILYQGAALKYATKRNGTWTTSVLHPGPIGFHSDLALDAKGYLHASFFDWQERRLKYARSRFSVSPRFRVTAPHAGDFWISGAVYTIAWEADYMPEDAFIDGIRLWRDTVPVAEILPPSEQTPLTGSIQWRVPENVPPGDYYLVEASVSRGAPGSQTRFTDGWAGPFFLNRPR